MTSTPHKVGTIMHPLSRLLGYLISASCLLGLTITIVTNFEQYSKGKTSNTIAWVKQDGHEYPYIVFCPDRPQEDMSKYKTHPILDEFRRSARNISVEFAHLGIHEMQRNIPIDEEPVMNDVYTAYNGICKGFHIKGKYPSKTTAVFRLPPGKGGETVFILRHPNETALLAYQAYKVEAFHGVILGSGEIMIVMKKMRYHTQIQRGIYCVEDNDLPTYSGCTMEHLAEHLKNSSVPCLPPPLVGIHPALDSIADCADEESVRNATGTANDFFYHGLYLLDEPCRAPCWGFEYQYSTVPLVTGNGPSGTDPTGADRYRYVLVRFTNDFVEQQEEFFVFDKLTLITASGGAMGMFVGWSCLQVKGPVTAMLDAADSNRRKEKQEEEKSEKSIEA